MADAYNVQRIINAIKAKIGIEIDQVAGSIVQQVVHRL